MSHEIAGARLESASAGLVEENEKQEEEKKNEQRDSL